MAQGGPHLDSRQESGDYGSKRPIRLSEAIRMTPAMVLGVADHIWTVGELVEAAMGTVEIEPPPGRPVGPFRVIDGGLL